MEFDYTLPLTKKEREEKKKNSLGYKAAEKFLEKVEERFAEARREENMK